MNALTTKYLVPSLLRRFAAMVYDSLLIMAISIFYGAMVTGINILIKGLPATGERVTWGAWGILVCAGWLATLIFFFCFFWHKSGQTLGMKTWRMKIISRNTGLPTYKQCLLRCVCAPCSLLIFGIGYFWMYFDEEHQTLHDKISNTQTILLAKDKK